MLTLLLVHAIQCCTQLMCSRLFRVVVECEASGASRMQVDAYAAGAPGGGPVLQALAGSPQCRRGSPRCGQPGSRGWFINGWVWNGLRQPVLWMTAGIVVGAQPRFRLRVSTRLLFVRLEKLLFYKGIFFQCSVFSSSTWTALSWSGRRPRSPPRRRHQ